MVWALLPLLFLALIFGFTAIERDLASVTPPAAPFQTADTSAAAAAAQTFIVWHNAVMTYAQQQVLGSQSYATVHQIYSSTSGQAGLAYTLGYFGGIQPSWLIGYEITPDQATGLAALNAGATICDPGFDGKCGPHDTAYDGTNIFNQDYICIWMNAPPGTAAQITGLAGRDFTFGTVTPDGQSWVQVSGFVNGQGQSILPIPAQSSNPTQPVSNPQPLSLIPCVTQGAEPSAGDVFSYAVIQGN